MAVYGLRCDVPLVLEEAIKQKLPSSLTRQIRTRYRNTATLGNLLHEVNNNLQMTGFDADFPRVANLVNDTGRKAVHQGLLSEDEADPACKTPVRPCNSFCEHDAISAA